jgi:hypothetical protein
MGNRCNVIFHNGKGDFSPAIYLHWNGGIESILSFLDEMDRRNICGCGDLEYQAARFVHVVCDLFDNEETSSTSIGISNIPDITPETIKQICPGDNGVFLIKKDKETEIKCYYDGRERPIDYTREIIAEYRKDMEEMYKKQRPIIGK